MKPLVLAGLLLAAGVGAQAQITTVSVRRIEAGPGYRWTTPRFAPDGKSIFFTRTGYRGIWVLRLDDGVRRRITDDRGAGYGFVISPDGGQIAYRRTSIDPQNGRRRQEIVLQNLVSGLQTTVSSGARLPVPAFAGGDVLHSSGTRTQGLSSRLSTRPVVLGIEATKIAVAVHGVKKLLDPLGKGNYIWPALSPGGTQLVAVDLERGAFVCDLEGNVNVRLGRRNAPAWTRDGRWIVYMDDRDDGHSLISSDLYAVSADGATTVRLTDTPDVHEMYPDCSPAESIILCSSLAGDLYLLTYGEE